MTKPTQVPISDLDLFDDGVLEDPYPHYRVLRDTAPVVYLESRDTYAVPRYAEIRQSLRDSQTFSSEHGVAFNDEANEILVGTVLGSDPPQHTAMRRILSDRLAPPAIRKLKPELAERAAQHVTRLVEQGEFDAAVDLAQGYITSVVPDLVGLPEEGRELLPEFGTASFDSFGGANERTTAALKIVGAMFTDYIAVVATRDRLAPGSMGMTVWEAVDRGDLAEELAIPLLAAYVGPAIDTTVTAITSAVILFAEHPDEWRKVRGNPELIPAALDEVLRFDSPVQVFGRRATMDCEVSGIPIPKDASVALIFGSGNRDARHYPDPDRFDVERDASDHLAFGFGRHRCAGSPLARLQAEGILTALAQHVESFSCGEVIRGLNNTARTFVSVPVQVTRS